MARPASDTPADRWFDPLLRQVLVESILLSLLAAGLGLLLTAWGTRALLAIVPADLPRAGGAGFNSQALVFAVFVALGAGLLFGAIPAFQSMTSGLEGPLKEARRDSGVGGNPRVRGSLIALEVALAFVLLIGAGLAIRSFELHTSSRDCCGGLHETLAAPEPAEIASHGPKETLWE